MIVQSVWASWLIVLGLSLGPAVSNGLARFAYGLVLPAMRQDLSWSYTEAGWVNTANGIGYLIGALLALRYIGTWGARALFIYGLILTTLALVASGLTRDMPSLLGYFLFGVGYIVYMTFLVAWMRDQGADAQMVARTWGVLGAAVMLSPLAWRGIGLSFFMGPASVTNFSRKNLPEAQWGRSVALYTTVFALGQTVGPVAAGFVADAAKSLSFGLLAAGGALLLGAVISVLQKPLR
jgi:MFS family permease